MRVPGTLINPDHLDPNPDHLNLNPSLLTRFKRLLKLATMRFLLLVCLLKLTTIHNGTLLISKVDKYLSGTD